MADDARERALQANRAIREKFAREFQPPRDEWVDTDLLIKRSEDGGVRAYPTLTVNGQPVALSRAGWEMILPRLLQLIYGGRVAEAGIALAANDAPEEEAAHRQHMLTAMETFGKLVVLPHPLEMAPATQEDLAKRPTTLAERKRRSAEEMNALLRRKEKSE